MGEGKHFRKKYFGKDQKKLILEGGSSLMEAGTILESKGMRAIFQKKGKKGQNVWKFEQKCAKYENILKKGRWLRNLSIKYALKG